MFLHTPFFFHEMPWLTWSSTDFIPKKSVIEIFMSFEGERAVGENLLLKGKHNLTLKDLIITWAFPKHK